MNRLFSFDLDGTLLNNEGSIFIENIEAIEKASKKGHKIAIATGRNYIYAQLAIKQYWGLFDYFVGCNGGIMHSIRERKVYLEEEKISFDFVPSIIDEIKEVGGTIQISTDKDVFVEMYIYEHNLKIISDNVKKNFFDSFKRVKDMDEEDKKSIIQISVHFEEHNLRKYWTKWNELYGLQYEFTITSKNNIDINLKNINKLMRIKEIAKIEDVLYENVFVFGDSQNDNQALEYYNNTYAMENSLPETKKSAKNIIGNNNSKDISKAILKNI